MSDLAQWSALVGFLLPLLVAVLQRPQFSQTVRTVVGICASIVAALITAWAETDLNWHTWSTAVIFIALTSWTTYKRVWVPVGAAPLIEAKTSPGSTVVYEPPVIAKAVAPGQPGREAVGRPK